MTPPKLYLLALVPQERALENSNYDAPQSEITDVIITEDVINNQVTPVYQRTSQSSASDAQVSL